jgi:gliding motility-associated-like protein
MKFPIHIQNKGMCRLIASCFFLALLFSQKAFAQPTVSSISPTSASAGATVVITGTNFNTTPANNTVFFGPVKATVTFATGTVLSVTVPAGAAHSHISVLNISTGLSATSTQFFTPVFSPNKPGLITADITVQGNIGGGISPRLYSLGANDLNNDGKPDLVMTTGNTGDQGVYIRGNISTTAIAFSSAITFTVAGGLLQSEGQISFGDLDGDARPDVVVPGNNANAFVILRNNNSGGTINAGSFTSSIVATALSTIGSVISDFDLNGRPDIAVSAYGSSAIIAYPNNTVTPGSIAIGSGITMTGSAFQSLQLVAADLDGDGKPEIIAPQNTSNAIHFYSNTSTPGSISFGTRQSLTIFPPGSNASFIAMADLNSDGKPDMVVTNNNFTNANAIAVLRNTSAVNSITFSVTTQQIGTAPYAQGSASFADMNGDGKPDLVIGLENDFDPGAGLEFRIAVLYNTSVGDDISFSAPIEYVSGTTSLGYSVIASDMNGDGFPDILVPGGNSGNISVYRGSPQFAPTISSFSPLSAAPLSGSVVITGTGFNPTAGNNIVEFGTVTATVTAASSTSLTVTVPRNASYAPITVLNRSNTLSASSQRIFMPAVTPNKPTLDVTDFVQQAIFSVTGTLYGLAAGDLTGDGKPELVVTNAGNTSSLIILGNISTLGGPVAFGAPTVFTPTSGYDGARYVSIADMDGNGWLDLVVPSFDLSTVGVFLNSGTGTVSTAFTLTGSFVTGMGPIGVATGDLDGDGKPEIVTSNDLGSSVSVLRNTSTNTNAVSFAAKQDYDVSAPNAVFNVALADIDNDGKLDIVAGRDAGVNSKVVFLRNTSVPGSISFASKVEIAGPRTPWTIVPGDVNGDGLTDLVVSAGGSTVTQIFAYTKLSSGGALTNLGTTSLDVEQANIAVALADLNGDGKPDVISGNRDPIPSTTFRTFIYPNTTSGTTTSFGTRLDLPGSYQPFSTLATDLNGDGRPDIVMGNQANFNNQSTIRIFRNTLVAPPVTQATGITVTSLTGTTGTFSWTAGSGSKRALFIKADNTGSAAPVTGTDYTANTVFASGSQIGGTGWYCVYNGTGNLVNVTGFTPSTSYRAMVTEFNDGGLSNTAQYNTNTATNNPLTFTARATVTAISRTTASATINTNTADFRVTFNASMTGMTISNFSLSSTGVTGASVTAVAGSGTVFTVTANTGSGDGTLGLNLANTTSMAPGVTNALSFIGELYTIDKTAPTLSSVTIVSNNSNTSRAKTGDMITLNFTSGEAIGVPVVTLAGQTVAATTTGSNNWTASYTMTGTDTEGNISFNIAFSDVNDNVGTDVSATTNTSTVVFDRTSPVLSTVTISSNNSNTVQAKQGNTVTLNFTTGETINAPVVIIAGHTVTANNSSGNNWTASYAMGGTDAEGAVSFSIAFADLAGNAGSTVTATTNSSSVIFDKTTPTLSSVNIVSNNANTSRAKTGNIISVSFTAAETITAPTVSIATHTVTAINTSGNIWTAIYTMTASDAEGSVPFNIAFSDVAGNAGSTVSSTTNSSSVVFDKTAPILSTVTIASNNTNTSRAKTGNIISVNFTAAENIQAPTVSIATHVVTAVNTGGNTWTATYSITASDAEGTVPFSIAFNDVAGNTGVTVLSTTNSSNVVFDKTTPVLPTVTIVSDNTNTGRAKPGNIITLSFTAAEIIPAPTVSIAAHTVTAVNTSGNTWAATYTMISADAEGIIPFSIAFNDVTGNAGTTVSSTTNSGNVIFDKTTPTLSTVTIVSDNTNTTRAKTGNVITLDFIADENIQAPSVSIATQNVTAVNTGGNTWTATYTMTGAETEGIIPFSIAFSDVTGNAGTTVSSTTNSSNVVFDKTNPTLVSVVVVSNNSNTAWARPGDLASVNFAADETILTPSITIATHTVTAVNTTGNIWTAVYTMTAADAEGVIPFAITFADISGNAGTTVSATTNNSNVIFDKTVPALSPVVITSTNSNSAYARAGDVVTVNFTGTETLLTPVVNIAAHTITPVNTTGNVWTASYIMTGTDSEGNIPFSIAFTDRAGNAGSPVTGTTNSSKVVYDIAKPVLSVVSIGSNNTISSIAGPGNIITLSFVTNETILIPTITLAGQAISASNTGPNTWTATYTMQLTDTEGTIAYSIVFSDVAGNAGTMVTTSTNGSKVVFSIPPGPGFAGGATQSLTVCTDAGLSSINSLLRAFDNGNGTTVTWSVLAAPAHGSLSGFNTTATTNSGIITPAGLGYQSFAGYSGTDVFTVRVSNGTLSATATINVSVSALPSGSITSTGGAVLCTGSSLTLTASGGSTYKWFKDGVSVPGNTASQLVITTAGVYTAIIVNAAGCETPAANNITITQLQQPKADFTPDVNTCINLSLLFTNTSITTNSGTVSYLWNDGKGLTSTAVSPSFTYSQAGAYSIKLKVIPQACPALADSITKTINTVQAIAGIRNPAIEVAKNQLTQLTVRQLPGATYLWSPAKFLIVPNVAGPTIVAAAEQEYLISQKVPGGCITVDTLLVRVHENITAYLPNVFTPNGDGQNDILMPNLVGVKQLRFFRIFNRWGKMLFETTNIGVGWNGKYNGVLQPLDTYTWSIEGYDGNGIFVKRQGSVTLIR